MGWISNFVERARCSGAVVGVEDVKEPRWAVKGLAGFFVAWEREVAPKAANTGVSLYFGVSNSYCR